MSLLLARSMTLRGLSLRENRLAVWPFWFSMLMLVGLSLTPPAAVHASSASTASHREGAPPTPAGPGASFATVEAAALDALAWVTREKGAADRGRVFVGAIHVRPDGRYAYQRPTRSEQTLFRRRPPVLRLSLQAEDVASYVVYPKTGATRVDRLNEQPSPGLRRVVDEVDPRRRPLYLLTPSLRVVRYAAHAMTVIAGRGMKPIRTSEEPSLAGSVTLVDAMVQAWRALFAPRAVTTVSR